MPKIPERKFIHDIASPLSTAMFMAEILRDEIAANPAQEAELKTVDGLYASLEAIRLLLQARRDVLVARDKA